MATKPRIVLGISYYHGDSSACLVVDGKLVAAVEEERLKRIKHYALFPDRAIEYCLKHAKIEPAQVDAVAIAKKPFNALTKKAATLLKNPQLLFSKRKYTPEISPQSLSTLLKRAGLKRASIVRVEHHLAHMMSVRYQAPGDQVALLSFDGLGDFVSTAIGRPLNGQIEMLDRVYFPHSLGFFYSAMTHYLGFPHFGDEYKVMGLSSYGEPRYLNAMRELVRESSPFGFQLNLEAFPIVKNPIRFWIEKSQPKMLPFYSHGFLTHVIGVPPRKLNEPLSKIHWDLAKSVQVRFEEIANHLLIQLHARVEGSTLALSGGCAHNSVWVGQIPRVTPYKKIFVAPASHDAGIAVGAAISASQVAVSCEEQNWALLGPSEHEATSPPERATVNAQKKIFNDEKQLIRWMVKALCSEKIIGLMHGRMEFGPRALGSRSILCDPRTPSMRDKLNQRVKHRELFRPFAASVLWDHQDEWFMNSFFSPAMEAVFEVKASRRGKIPAVVHVDNTCRIQSVTAESQPFFYALIEQFRKETGIPMLLNTSFNDNEPIVASPGDAMKCFANTEMDHLVIGLQTFSRAASEKSVDHSKRVISALGY